MTTRFHITHDSDVNAVYLRVKEAQVARTIEIKPMVFADLDDSGNPIGIEFVNSNDFFEFAKDFEGTIDLPESLFFR
jgi:uncharacterized protein YuzE